MLRVLAEGSAAGTERRAMLTGAQTHPDVLWKQRGLGGHTDGGTDDASPMTPTTSGSAVLFGQCARLRGVLAGVWASWAQGRGRAKLECRVWGVAWGVWGGRWCWSSTYGGGAGGNVKGIETRIQPP